MKLDLSLYKEDFYGVIGEKITVEEKERLDEIFSDLEAELGFLDEKRQEAEDNLRVFIEVLNEQNKQNENSEELFNFL